MQEKTFHVNEEHAQAGDPPSRLIIDQEPVDNTPPQPVVLKGGIPGGGEFHAA